MTAKPKTKGTLTFTRHLVRAEREGVADCELNISGDVWRGFSEICNFGRAKPFFDDPDGSETANRLAERACREKFILLSDMYTDGKKVKIFSSPYKRCYTTAVLIHKLLCLLSIPCDVIIVDNDLGEVGDKALEIHFGRGAYRTMQSKDKHANFEGFDMQISEETDYTADKRFKAVYAKYHEKVINEDAHIICVTHGDAISSICVLNSLPDVYAVDFGGSLMTSFTEEGSKFYAWGINEGIFLIQPDRKMVVHCIKTCEGKIETGVIGDVDAIPQHFWEQPEQYDDMLTIENIMQEKIASLLRDVYLVEPKLVAQFCTARQGRFTEIFGSDPENVESGWVLEVFSHFMSRK